MKDKNKFEITEDDLNFLIELLKKEKTPLPIHELTSKLAFHKTEPERAKPIKIYNPYSDYDIGDFVYKYYDEPLKIGSKGIEHFKGGVVLEVKNKIPFPQLNCDMLEVEYHGGGLFRKYTDYMKKTKTQVLLPCNMEGKSEPVKFLSKEKDPRREELPLKKEDIKSLEAKLKNTLTKNDKFYHWNEYWYLTESMGEISEEKIPQVEQFLRENKESIGTKELIEKFFFNPQVNPDVLSLELNYLLEHKFRKKFVLVSPDGWGKWNLKENLEAFRQKIPLSAEKALMPAIEINKKEIQEKRKESGITTEKSFPCKLNLTWREVLSGGIKIPSRLRKYFSKYREYYFKNKEDGKEHIVYYYPDSGYLLGFKKVFEEQKVIQGSSINFEYKEENKFNFLIKKAKKKFSILKKVYNSDEDRIFTINEEVISFCSVNKIIYLGDEIFEKITKLYSERNNLNLVELLRLVFKTFGVEEENYKLHYLRAYHIVDVLKLSTQEEIETILLASPEFFPSKKEEGFFHLDLKKVIREKEVPEKEIKEEIVEKVEKEMRVVEKIPELERKEELYKTPPLPSPPEEKKPREKEFKKSKVKKSKKLKVKREIPKRAAKSARKRIEEKIEWEESEKEVASLYKEEVETPTKKEIEEEKSKEIPVHQKAKFGLFAQKLQQALQKEEKKKKRKK